MISFFFLFFGRVKKTKMASDVLVATRSMVALLISICQSALLSVSFLPSPDSVTQDL